MSSKCSGSSIVLAYLGGEYAMLRLIYAIMIGVMEKTPKRHKRTV